MGKLPLFPEQASTFAPDVDHLLYYLLAVSVFFTLLIFGAIFYFAVRYRRRSEQELPRVVHTGLVLEIVWSVIPFGLTMVMFTWGAAIFFRESRPPDDALPIYVVGKQWMWKLQHMEGQREINELHVPLGRAIKLTMTSEDVIHSFFVPAFRTKQDVVPGRYSTTWWRPTKAGKYHLFCAEYCGTKHSGMIGWIYVMEPQDYQVWLSGGAGSGSLADNGQKLFQDLACVNCHKPDGSGRCPTLVGLYGKDVKLADGRTVKADEAYLRESILQPNAKVVGGFQPVMPTFQGLVTEEGVLSLIEYVKSMAEKPGVGPAVGSGATPAVRPAPEKR
ncbi:MAG TPA: cytochrome c oxidase subunit II [Candidatus Sulfopaludibacter sp.]|jgi:cytochrome c oxidase subunit 2|nr:cytochrome c oxidase subunit II [Candidatus Sulfopaludibacter sp.]